jgi:disease resistance protein
MAKEEGTKCQRIGCDALFTPDNNPEGSCHYHSGPPLFHDGGKEWSCCKQRSHDFSLFLSIPGCTTGKHTSEKPASKAAPSPNKSKQVSSGGNTSLNAAQAACIRCRQGFFCSDHGAKAGMAAAAQLSSQKLTSSEPIPKPLPPPVTKKASAPKMIDLNANQVCKHKGCGNTFTEKENHSTACHYHPGPAVFHDRSKGVKHAMPYCPWNIFVEMYERQSLIHSEILRSQSCCLLDNVPMQFLC